MAEQLLMKNKKLLHSSILNVARPVTLWSGGLTLTSQSISIPMSKLTNIDKLDLYFQQMGSDLGSYTNSVNFPVNGISTTEKSLSTNWSIIGAATVYFAGGILSYQKVSTNLVIKWKQKGYWQASGTSAGTMSYVDTGTIDNGISLTRISGYESLPLVNIYKKSEVDDLISTLNNRFSVKTDYPIIQTGYGAGSSILRKSGLSVSMSIENVSYGAPAPNSTIAIIPTGFRPASNLLVPIFIGESVTASYGCYINTSGEVTWGWGNRPDFASSKTCISASWITTS